MTTAEVIARQKVANHQVDIVPMNVMILSQIQEPIVR